MRMKRYIVVCAGLVTMIAIGFGAVMPPPGLFEAVWDGGGDGVNYSDGFNWDIDFVPCNDGDLEFGVTIPEDDSVTFDGVGKGTSCEVTQFILEDDATFLVNPGTDYSVLDVAEFWGIIDAQGGDLTAVGFGASFSGNRGRVYASDGSIVVIGADTYSSTGIWSSNGIAMFTASGVGTVLDLSSVQSLDAGYDDFAGNTVTWQEYTATDSAVLDLSGVETLSAPAHNEDRIDFTVSTDASLEFSSLQTITSALDGQTVFIVSDTGSLTLPSLQTITTPGGFGRTIFDLSAGATVELPSLATAEDLMFNVREGSVMSVNGPQPVAYSATGLWSCGGIEMFTASGVGTVLDLSSVQSLDAGYDDFAGNTVTWQEYTATDSAVLDLSGVETLSAPAHNEDRIELIVSAAALMDISSLETLSSASAGTVQMKLSGGGELRVGDLEISANTTITLDDPQTTLRAAGGFTAVEGTSVPIVINDADGVLDIDGSLQLGTEITIAAPNGARE